MQLYLDADGVIVNLEKYFYSFFGMMIHEYETLHGSQKLWNDIEEHLPDIFSAPEPMRDAHELVEAVIHLKPIVLTGVPRGQWATEQKHDWFTRHFPHLPVITCKSRKKHEYCSPGDILIDDRTIYKHLWERAGGTYIVHTSTRNSLKDLRNMGIIT